ncbi:MAG TPA: hypothetical protein DCL61_12150 [Cyanobacteria bacterium UBA12227]|nr:hypothetical protein [Cyanobacteria bacterium UBA12227]HAX88216.1 hypothetical protein [Cyanobacteria bacterium UBA11370]HBY76479.1 hypothetical protein [Cyanobacteria bacterium UBA11148]
MTRDDENRPKRRRRGEKKSQKGISVYLTFQEWRLLRAASSQLGKSIALMMREYTIDRIEQETNLKLGDFSNEPENEDED